MMVMAVGAVDGTARLAMIGLGHSVAYALGALWLGHRLRRRVGRMLSFELLRPLSAAIVLGLTAWLTMRAWAPSGRVSTLVALVSVGAVGSAAYLAVLRALGGLPSRSPDPVVAQ